MLRVRIFLAKNKLLKINLEKTICSKRSKAPFRVHVREFLNIVEPS